MRSSNDAVRFCAIRSANWRASRTCSRTEQLSVSDGAFQLGPNPLGVVAISRVTKPPVSLEKIADAQLAALIHQVAVSGQRMPEPSASKRQGDGDDELREELPVHSTRRLSAVEMAHGVASVAREPPRSD
jgi:hypothetical protein